MYKFILHIILIQASLFWTVVVFASPNYLTVHSRISKPDNAGYLEAASVQFRLSITDPVGTCILFQEDFANVDMSSSKGLIAIKMGSGVKAYPGGAMTMKDLFTNFSSPVFNCQSGGTYTAGANDQRKLVMQFNDGTGWQTVPSLDINSVPFALEALSSQKLGAFPAADYVRTAQFTTCNPGEAVHFNGTTFTCIASGIANGGNAGVMTIGTNDASSLNFETNNTTRMTIDSTGNVGVGGAIVPAATLHTQTSGAKTSTTTSNYIENNATSGTNTINKVGLDIQSTGVWNGAGANNVGLNVNVSGGTNNYAAIFQGGNVGIGTAAPISLLDVRATSGSSNQIYLRGDSGAGGYVASYLQLVSGADSRGRGLLLTSTTGEANASWYAGVPYTGGGFQIGNNGVNYVESGFGPYHKAAAKFFIDPIGNVGIGTTTPQSLLHVAAAPMANANYGLLSLASGPFDGATAGFYSGSANGTVMAANAASGYTGDLMNLQVAGSSKFKVAATGSTKVNGQLATKSQTIAGGTTSIDWNNGNSIMTDYDCASVLTFANLQDGGTYTLVVTGVSITQCSFSTTTTGTDAAVVTYRFNPANGARTATTYTVYTLMRIGTVVLVSWSSGF